MMVVVATFAVDRSAAIHQCSKINTSKKFTTTLSLPINTHSIAVESQHRNCNAVVPDPIFPRPHTKEENSGLAT